MNAIVANKLLALVKSPVDAADQQSTTSGEIH
jgi:hypothetical protein